MEQKEFSASTKKAIKIFTIEMIVIATVMLVIGILVMTQIIKFSKNAMRYIPYIGIAGGTWLVVDLIWILCSKKRQAKTSVFDKILTTPLGLAILAVDITILALGYDSDGYANIGVDFIQYFFGSAFMYITIIYIVMAIYHIKKPIPALLLEDDEEDKKSETINDINSIVEAELTEEKGEEQKEEPKTEENREEEKSE